MASWQGDDDLGWENAYQYQQPTWKQLRRQRADMQQLRKPTITTSGPPHQSYTDQHATDNDTDNIKLSSHQQYYHSYYPYVNDGYSDCLTDRSSLVFDADSPASKNHRFHPTLSRSTHPVNYIDLNRRRLKGHNNQKFIYPEKTYTDMFTKKKEFPVEFANHSRKNDSRSSLMSSFSLHKANDRLVHSLQSPRSLRSPNQPQYQSRVSGSATSTYAEQKQPQKYAVLPPISAYSAQTQPAYSGTPSNTQRVSVDITIRLPESDTAGHVIQTSGPAPAATMMTSSQWHGPPTKTPALTPISDVERHHRVVTRPRWH